MAAVIDFLVRVTPTSIGCLLFIEAICQYITYFSPFRGLDKSILEKIVGHTIIIMEINVAIFLIVLGVYQGR
jgi:hypothetical protein